MGPNRIFQVVLGIIHFAISGFFVVLLTFEFMISFDLWAWMISTISFIFTSIYLILEMAEYKLLRDTQQYYAAMEVRIWKRYLNKIKKELLFEKPSE